MQLKQIWREVKDYVFPIHCLQCQKEGEWVCSDCLATIDLSGIYACPVCHRDQIGGVCCQGCVSNSFLDSQIALAEYSEKSLVGNIIQNLKYYYAEDLQMIIKKIMVKSKFDLTLANVEYVVPIPLHKKRIAERGFNQAEVIAKLLAEYLHKPMLEALQRVKGTAQQAKLGKEARLKNMVKAFAIKEPIRGQVILVDDVFTTGSTMQEAAKVLRQSGVEKIYGFSLARG